MSKPLWWKNAVKLIKDFTTEDSYMTFQRYDNNVMFFYNVRIDGVNVTLDEMVSIDTLECDRLQGILTTELHEIFASMIREYIDDLDYHHIVGM